MAFDHTQSLRCHISICVAWTLLLVDVMGFTAWSSVREPSQVFELLENVYGKFDELAKKRRVFKVETVGDW